MKDHKKNYFTLLAFLLVCIFYLVIQYLSPPKLYGGNYYIPDFSVSTEIYNSGTLNSTILNNTSEHYDLFDYDRVNSTQNITNLKILVKIVSTGDQKLFKVEYSDLAMENTSRNVFVGMKDIKKSVLNIFFLETRCSTEKMAEPYKNNKGFILNARQCCAIESTALTNLNRKVYIFHSCPVSDDFINHSPEFVKRLFAYPNVHAVRLNNTEAFLGSPVQELYDKKQLETSQHPIEHTSDVLRLTLLWKFGGTYCDLDVVTIRSLNGLHSNWAGMQDGNTIANGVLNFEPEGVAHTLLQQALEHINKHFDGASWSTNGPLLITPIILRECNVSSVTDAMRNCHGNFTVYDSNVLYPIYYPLAQNFFNEDIGKEIVKNVKSSSYSVHIWNKMSHNLVGKVGSTQAYALLAEEFCPEIYHNCGSHF